VPENLAKGAPRIAKLRQDLTAEATDADDQAALKDIQKLGVQLVASSKKASEGKASGDVATAAAMVRGEYAASGLAYTGTIAKWRNPACQGRQAQGIGRRCQEPERTGPSRSGPGVQALNPRPCPWAAPAWDQAGCTRGQRGRKRPAGASTHR
jgi:hypothetical protein